MTEFPWKSNRTFVEYEGFSVQAQKILGFDLNLDIHAVKNIGKISEQDQKTIIVEDLLDSYAKIAFPEPDKKDSKLAKNTEEWLEDIFSSVPNSEPIWYTYFNHTFYLFPNKELIDNVLNLLKVSVIIES